MTHVRGDGRVNQLPIESYRVLNRYNFSHISWIESFQVSEKFFLVNCVLVKNFTYISSGLPR